MSQPVIYPIYSFVRLELPGCVRSRFHDGVRPLLDVCNMGLLVGEGPPKRVLFRDAVRSCAGAAVAREWYGYFRDVAVAAEVISRVPPHSVARVCAGLSEGEVRGGVPCNRCADPGGEGWIRDKVQPHVRGVLHQLSPLDCRTVVAL